MYWDPHTWGCLSKSASHADADACVFGVMIKRVKHTQYVSNDGVEKK